MVQNKGESSKDGGVSRIEKNKGKAVENEVEEALAIQGPLVEKIGGRKKISKDVYIAAFMKCDHVPTRWIDKGILASLGILDDVRLVLRNIGLEKVLEMDHLVYPREVSHLLGSFELKVKIATPLPPIEELGFVKFFVDGICYTLTLEKLCEAYGFPPKTGMGVSRLAHDKKMDALTWSLIGQGDYTAGGVKATCLSNPTIRFVHRVLASTLYARNEKDRVKEDEMAFLANGIKPLFKEKFEEQGIEGYESVNLGIILAQRILALKQKWILSARRKSMRTYIGGFLTPMLMASGVPLGSPCPRPRIYLDMHHLGKTSFIGGRDGDKFVYHFVGSNKEYAMALLPNQEITRLDCVENLNFTKGEKTTNEEEILNDLVPLEKRKRIRHVQGSSSHQELPLGSSRYYQPSFKGKVPSAAIKHALEGVEKSQRCNKWHSRALSNIKNGFKKEIKGLKSQVADLKSIIETFVLRKKAPPKAKRGSSSYDLALEEVRRHSISHLPSQQSTTIDDPPRASSHEVRAPRRKRRHLPTPSPPSSDNISFHLSDSYSES